jgi:hypothetical protein
MTTKNPAPAATSPVEDRRVQPDGPLSGEVKRGGEVTLGTSGEIIVSALPSTKWGGRRCTWPALDLFTQDYIVALFESWRDRVMRLPTVERREWPDFAFGPKPYWQAQQRPYPDAVVADDGTCWEVVWHGVGEIGEFKRLRAQEWRNGLRFSDLAPGTLAQIIADCAAFRPPVISGAEFWTLRQAGHCPPFPPLTAYLDDDGEVYLREAQ